MRKGERLVKDEGPSKLLLGAARAGCCWGVWEPGKDTLLRVVPNEGKELGHFPPKPLSTTADGSLLAHPLWHFQPALYVRQTVALSQRSTGIPRRPCLVGRGTCLAEQV